MSFAIAIVALCAAGLALLRILRLQLGSLPADLGLAWFVGGGYFAIAVAALRFAVGLPYNNAVCVAVLIAPPLVWAALRRRIPTGSPPSSPAAVMPPRWMFPVVLYVLVTTAFILVHGFNTPTLTDDGVRVRAFAPLLAVDDVWSADARQVFAMSGAVPTFVPTIALRLFHANDHFHVNYVTLTDLVALVVLLVGSAAARGRSARGWLSAFAILTLPLFVYHCTSTYAEAALAIHLAVAMHFLIAFDESSDPKDAARVFVLLAIAATIKREGELVAGPVALLVGLATLMRVPGTLSRRGWPIFCFVVPYLVYVVAKIAAVGAGQAFPLLPLFTSRIEASTVSVAAGSAKAAGAVAAPMTAQGVTALQAFGYALFKSGNAGIVFFALVAALPLAFLLWRRAYRWTLAAVAILFGEAAVSSLWLLPQYTLDQTTVHRALIPVSVAAAVWLASFLYDAATADPERG